MAVSRKGKRPIVVDGRTYLWWVFPDGAVYVPTNGITQSLMIVDDCGEFGVQYYLGQLPDLCHLTVMGRRFRVSGCGGSHRRFRCPVVVNGPVATPRTVAELIKWSTDAGDNPVEVDYQGLPIANRVFANT